jgi:hypothetical protein
MVPWTGALVVLLVSVFLTVLLARTMTCTYDAV